MIETTDCIPWRGSIDVDGYGRAGLSGRAHRVVYETFVGPIPEGLQIDHLCRNRACVNPAHLEVVTQAENKRRGLSPFANHARQTTCINGHPFTPENTYRWRGQRACRPCNRASVARSRAKRREDHR